MHKEGNRCTYEGAKKVLPKIVAKVGVVFGLCGKDSHFRFQYGGRNKKFACCAVSYGKSGRRIVLMTNSDVGFPFRKELSETIPWHYQWPDKRLR